MSGFMPWCKHLYKILERWAKKRQTSVLAMAGSPTIACSSGDTPQTLFNPPVPPFRFAPALALLTLTQHVQ